MLEQLLSSRVRARILITFFLSPGVEYNAWELAQTLSESYSAVWRELNRLESLGILRSESRGNSRNFQVNSDSPITDELRAIVLKTEGFGEIIRQRIHRLGKIQRAFIFGSVAAGTADANSDIDLLLIGDVHLEELSSVIFEAEKAVNRPINYLIYSEAEWNEKLNKQEPFALNVEQSPKILLIGEHHGV